MLSTLTTNLTAPSFNKTQRDGVNSMKIQRKWTTDTATLSPICIQWPKMAEQPHWIVIWQFNWQFIPTNLCHLCFHHRLNGLTTYTTKIRPLLEYACPIWGGIPDYLSLELQRVQDRCLKILGLPKDALETLASRRGNLTKNELERMMKSDTFKHLFKQSDPSYNLRRKRCNQVRVISV